MTLTEQRYDALTKEIREAFKNKVKEHYGLLVNEFGLEFNDEITRSKLDGMCKVWLYDLNLYHNCYVLCDDTVNTPQVIDDNKICFNLYVRGYINLGRPYRHDYKICSLTLGSNF